MNLENYKDVTISSLEIAEITGKQHKNIIRDIETQLTKVLGEEALLKFEQSYTNSNNREFKCYNLPKIEALIVVSGYDAKLRASIIYRLDELEKKNLQKLENQESSKVISYNVYLKSILEANKAKLESSNAKHQLTKEKLKNTKRELKRANETIACLKKKIKDIDYDLLTKGSEINLLNNKIKQLKSTKNKLN